MRMRPYFEKMQGFGKPVKENPANAEEIKKVEEAIGALLDEKKKAGLPAETLNKRGEWTVHQRLDYILDKGTWAPLHMLYDPMEEDSGTTGVVDGLGRINGRWCVIIGFDNKVRRAPGSRARRTISSGSPISRKDSTARSSGLSTAAA